MFKITILLTCLIIAVSASVQKRETYENIENDNRDGINDHEEAAEQSNGETKESENKVNEKNESKPEDQDKDEENNEDEERLEDHNSEGKDEENSEDEEKSEGESHKENKENAEESADNLMYLIPVDVDPEILIWPYEPVPEVLVY